MFRFRFNKVYFALALLLFVVEYLIGAYLHDPFIRPFGGDFLVVIWLYCLIRAFFDWPIRATALGVLLFAYLIEVGQYFHSADYVAHLLFNPITSGRLALIRILIGTSFEWWDLVAYTLGIAWVLLLEGELLKKKRI